MRIVLVAFLIAGGWVARAVEPWGLAKGGGVTVGQLAACDETGAASLTDAALPSAADEIVFLKPAAGVRSVGTLALTNRTLRFSAEAGTVLRTSGKTSPFRLSGGRWTFDGIAVEGSDLPDKAHYHGGAIDCQGGSLTATNCSFAHLGARFSGGAISARLMTGDIRLCDCTFATNVCGTVNGTGGAVYASGTRDGAPVTLTLVECHFVGNSAQNGGAVTTVCTVDDDEAPVTLDASACFFDGNSAEHAGGAISGDGSCILFDTLFTENTAGLQGGAVNLGSSRDACAYCVVGSDTGFWRNRVRNTSLWTCGGAIALWGEGSLLDVDGRFVIFRENSATSDQCGFGGAIFTASGTELHVSRAEFSGNTADDGGGAIYAWDGDAVVATSIFSNDTVVAENGYGGAVAVDGASLTVTNTTVRFANGGAVNVYEAQATLVNTVIVDNGDKPDIEVAGTGASLTMDYTAYGTIAASKEVEETIVTNACLSGVGSDIYRGDSLLLDTSSYNPVADQGMAQDATDYRNVEYGWQGGEHYSMGAYECPAPDDTPSVDVVKTVWYHNRADGLYYPRVTLRFLGGDATLFKTVTLRCDGTDYPLPESCVAQLRTATTVGQEFVFGVDDAHWVPSKDAKDGFGYIIGSEAEKKEQMLLSVADPARVSVVTLGEEHSIEVHATSVESPRTTAFRPLSAGALPLTVTVPAQFEDFKVGDSISGRTTVPTTATVSLYGTAALGGEWRSLGAVELDDEGCFTASVPSDVRFFQLKAEVAR